MVKGISEGSWFEFEEQFSAALTCKNVWDSVGTRGDFVLGTPSAFAACTGCWIDVERWFKPHFSVRVNLDVGRWSASVVKNKTFTTVWPTFWLPALDKSRSSSNQEVQAVWAVFEERLKVVDVASWRAIETGLRVGNTSSAWDAWSRAAENASAEAHCLGGGPLPLGGALGSEGDGCMLRMRSLVGFKLANLDLIGLILVRPVMLRGVMGPLYPLLLRLTRRLKICMDLAASILAHVLTLCIVELSDQCEKVLAAWSCWPSFSG